MAKIGSGLKSAVSLNENFRFLTSRSSNMILSPFALSSGLSVKIIISELKGGREQCLVMSPENQNHACFTTFSKDKSENEIYANQAQWIFRFGDVI